MSARLYLLAAALLFSTGGAAIKATALTSWQVASLRSLVAGIVLLVLLPDSRRGWSWRVGVAGVAYAVTLVSFAVATKLTTGANAIYLQSTGPLYLLAIGPLVLREKLKRSDWGLGAAVGVGMLFFVFDPGVATATAPDPARGNWYGAISGLGWAVTVACLRVAARGGGGSLAAVAVGNFIAFAAALPMAWPIPSPGVGDWAAVLYLGVLQIGLAYWCLTRGLQSVPAFAASALLLLEPALNPLWTWWLHDEVPSTYSILGGGVILTATMGNSWWSKNRVV
jgi:drug/metabolite transporter, DME family